MAVTASSPVIAVALVATTSAAASSAASALTSTPSVITEAGSALDAPQANAGFVAMSNDVLSVFDALPASSILAAFVAETAGLLDASSVVLGPAAMPSTTRPRTLRRPAWPLWPCQTTAAPWRMPSAWRSWPRHPSSKQAARPTRSPPYWWPPPRRAPPEVRQTSPTRRPAHGSATPWRRCCPPTSPATRRATRPQSSSKASPIAPTRRHPLRRRRCQNRIGKRQHEPRRQPLDWPRSSSKALPISPMRLARSMWPRPAMSWPSQTA